MTMAKEDTVDKVFEDDEMRLLEINAGWTPEDLLSKEGIFFLKDVVKALGLDPVKVKRKAKEIEEKGQSAWEVMGTRKVWNHWIVRMKVFAPFYRKNLIPKLKKVQKDWDGNTLLKQKGLFSLTDVCKVIPFTTHQLRYQAKNNPKSKKEYGIWKDKELNTFVVDMERFAPWINKLWFGPDAK